MWENTEVRLQKELFLFCLSICVTLGIATDEVLPFPAQSCEGGEGTVYASVLLEQCLE